MPFLSVALNGVEQCTVDTAGVDMLDAGSHACRTQEEFAHLDMHGGRYPRGDSSTFLTWIHCHPLASGDYVALRFEAHGKGTLAGKTIQELFPDEPPCTVTDFEPTAAELAERAARPYLRPGYLLELTEGLDGSPQRFATTPEDETIVWHWTWFAEDPLQVRFRVSTFRRLGGPVRPELHNLLSTKLPIGSRMAIRLSTAA